jgi:hypothetical protein
MRGYQFFRANLAILYNFFGSKATTFCPKIGHSLLEPEESIPDSHVYQKVLSSVYSPPRSMDPYTPGVEPGISTAFTALL